MIKCYKKYQKNVENRQKIGQKWEIHLTNTGENVITISKSVIHTVLGRMKLVIIIDV